MFINSLLFFFFNDTATTEIYTLSLHDALPIYVAHGPVRCDHELGRNGVSIVRVEPDLVALKAHARHPARRSEEHTSELQSQSNLVCRLLLETKKTQYTFSYLYDQAHTASRSLT